MKLLLVEDDPIAMRVIGALLRENGYEVDTARDGAEALTKLGESTYRLVVTDWMMPVVDGIELVRRLRSAQGLSYTYVIMLSARGDDHTDANHALDAGVDDLLAKPVHRDDLLARLRVAERIIALQKQLLEQNHALSMANDHMRRDLHAAAQVQRALLPHAPPKAPGWKAEWRSLACDELGGDTLNVFQLDEHHLAAYVLDVSGHGVGSALLAVQASRLLQPVMGLGSMLKEPSPEPPYYRRVEPIKLMRNLATKFPPQWEAPQFFTIAYTVIEIATGATTVASGGHPPVLISHPDGGVEVVDLPSSAVGMLPAADCEFEEARLVMEHGYRMLIYSDGLTETMTDDGAIYGQERLVEVWGRQVGVPLAQALDALLADVAAFRGSAAVADDITILALERDA